MRILSHPIKKLTYLTAFAGGYVLGAKAGRERYEQIVQVAGQVKDDPRVQQAAEKAEDLARDAATKVTEKPQVKEAVAKAKDAVDGAKSNIHGATSEDTKSDDTRVDGVSPLLADQHVDTEEEVVYSAGPDIEETVDELSPSDDSERV